MSYSVLFLFHTVKDPSEILIHIKNLSEVVIIYTIIFILFETTKVHPASNNIFEKQFMLLVSKNEYSKYRYSPIPVSIQTSTFTLFVNGVVIAISNMLIYAKVSANFKLQVYWFIFFAFFIDYLIRSCIRYRQNLRLDDLFHKLEMRPT